MYKSQRLRGLELLRAIGAPVPSWQVVGNLQDVGRLKLPAVEFGWTIRTCRKYKGQEFGLYYVNYADPDTVCHLLRERLTTHGQDELYIVYPSWKFRFSCNVLLWEGSFSVEGVYGSQKDLASGKANPDFGIRLPFGLRNDMTFYIGRPDEEVISWLGKILWWCRRIPWESFCTEVALTQAWALVFYDLFIVRDQEISSLDA